MYIIENTSCQCMFLLQEKIILFIRNIRNQSCDIARSIQPNTQSKSLSKVICFNESYWFTKDSSNYTSARQNARTDRSG